jgi:hypothetical protein
VPVPDIYRCQQPPGDGGALYESIDFYQSCSIEQITRSRIEDGQLQPLEFSSFINFINRETFHEMRGIGERERDEETFGGKR